jgi:hypothetical protein
MAAPLEGQEVKISVAGMMSIPIMELTLGFTPHPDKFKE